LLPVVKTPSLKAGNKGEEEKMFISLPLSCMEIALKYLGSVKTLNQSILLSEVINQKVAKCLHSRF